MTSGTIVTFYSYKGGVGRSFALANIAAILHQWDYKVLCIDWDLEAPGLTQYFTQWLKRQPRPGLVELFQSFSSGKRPRWKHYVTRTSLKHDRGRIDVIRAGRADDGYVQTVQNLDWTRLYEKLGLGPFLESLREDWKKEYDFILVDSRTGVSDISGICTIQLPDMLVFLFGANEQSLEGACDIAKRSVESQSQLPFNRARLITLPVLSRFEMRVEYRISSAWLSRIQKRLNEFYAPWLPQKTRTKEILELTRIPNVPYWSFGEHIPVITDSRHNDDPESVNYAFRNLASLVAHKLASADQLILNRESYLARSAFDVSDKTITSTSRQPSIYISYSKLQSRLAYTLRADLKHEGYEVRTSADFLPRRSKRNESLRLLRDASIFVPIFAGPPSTSQHSEIESFVSTNVRDRGLNLILPVIVSEGAVQSIPRILTDLPLIDGRGLNNRKLAKKIVEVIDQTVKSGHSRMDPQLKFL